MSNNLLQDESKEIHPHLDITKKELPVKTVISLGILLNEMITNFIKYAFSDMYEGEIYISIEEKGANEYLLEYTDNGKGTSKNILESE